jgi:membrane protease YdiL (CAAX protease family)
VIYDQAREGHATKMPAASDISHTEWGAIGKATATAIGLLVAGTVVNVGAGVLALLIFGFNSVRSGGTGFLFAAIVGQLLVLGVAVGYIRWRDLSIPFAVPSRNESALIGIGVVVSVGAAIGLTVVRQELVSTDTSSGLAEIISSNPSLTLVVGALSVILIAPAEELLFRGAIQGRLRAVAGRWPAVLGASTLFAAWHLLNFDGPLVGVVLSAAIIGAVSVLWGYAYERTDNILVPILTHGLYNFALMALSLTG